MEQSAVWFKENNSRNQCDKAMENRAETVSHRFVFLNYFRYYRLQGLPQITGWFGGIVSGQRGKLIFRIIPSKVKRLPTRCQGDAKDIDEGLPTRAVEIEQHSVPFPCRVVVKADSSFPITPQSNSLNL